MPKHGRTKWIPRRYPPVREGEYECLTREHRDPKRLSHRRVRWDGRMFRGDFGCFVVCWRGLTYDEYLRRGGQ